MSVETCTKVGVSNACDFYAVLRQICNFSEPLRELEGGLQQTFRVEYDYPRSTESGRRCRCCCASPPPRTEGHPLPGTTPDRTARCTIEVGHRKVFSPAAPRGASKDPPKPLRPDSPLLRLAHRPPCLAAVPDANHQPRGDEESVLRQDQEVHFKSTLVEKKKIPSYAQRTTLWISNKVLRGSGHGGRSSGSGGQVLSVPVTSVGGLTCQEACAHP